MEGSCSFLYSVLKPPSNLKIGKDWHKQLAVDMFKVKEKGSRFALAAIITQKLCLSQ